MSLRSRVSLFTAQTAAACVFAGATALAQYPGQVAEKPKDQQTLRAIAVLEWTGELDKPKASRLVPVTVYDGQVLQDGNVYLARPEPLAVGREVEYELEKNGQPLGLYDVKNAGQQQGSWVGFGSWKPLPAVKAAAPKPVLDDMGDASSDRPVLHRKHPENGKDDGKADDKKDAAGPAAPSDPDRPTLHKPKDEDKTSSDDKGSGKAAGSEPVPDPDRPTLHGKSDADTSKTAGQSDSAGSDSAAQTDPDRPVLHAKKTETAASPAPNKGEDEGEFTDPDRPKLKRGKSSGSGGDALPTLMGMPDNMEQAVAVSDAKKRQEHLWGYTWANPEDELKMKQQMEDIARDALGLKAPAPAHAAKRATTARTRKQTAKQTAPAAPPPQLSDEQFRVFELAYGAGATMVLSASTDGPADQQKFVTLIAQPDLYGNVLVLLKHVSDGAHLDETPRMRLIDAVDAMADNRGELLFEMRGSTQRQFALYRVLRGRADKLFASGGGEYGADAK